MASWISVKDRLPQRSDSYDPWKQFTNNYSEDQIKKLEKVITVLTTFDGFVEVLPYFIEDPDLKYGMDRGPGFYFYPDEDGEYYEKNNDITHWMPLPEPPSKVKTNVFDHEDIYSYCTVQVLTNTTTGETSIGWWRNK